MPTDKARVTLKVFATDGVNSSAVVTEEYGANIVGQRQPHDSVTLVNGGCASVDLFPFGDSAPTPPYIYGNTVGVIVDDPEVVGYPDGYDGTATGTPAGETDEPYNAEHYDIKYGTLPATVTIQVPPAPPEQSDADKKMFSSRAMVIVQDGREPPEDPTISYVNKQFFSLVNAETSRDGAFFRTTAFEGAGTTGSFLKYYYNPRENIYTFYYRDGESNRWIISKEPAASAPNLNALSQMEFPSSGRAGPKVFKWIPFKRSRLI